MNVKTKRMLVTICMLCVLFASTAYAGVWGRVTTKAYSSFLSVQKLVVQDYATVNVTQGPVDNRCSILAYVRRIDNTAYKSEAGVYYTCGSKNLSYDDDNYYYGNYYHYNFEVMSKISPTSTITDTVVGGTITP